MAEHGCVFVPWQVLEAPLVRVLLQQFGCACDLRQKGFVLGCKDISSDMQEFLVVMWKMA